MIRFLHAQLTIYLLLRANGHGRLAATWKFLGGTLGWGQYLNADRWRWGPRLTAQERQGVAEQVDTILAGVKQAARQIDVHRSPRVKRVTITGALILEFGRTPYRIVRTAIPEDAQLEDAEWWPDKQELVLFISHPSWPVLAEGDLVPELEQTQYARLNVAAREPSLN